MNQTPNIRFFQEGKTFFLHLYRQRYLVYELIKRDFSARYIQNWFGLAWAVVEPLAFVAILWVVFSSLRVGQQMDVPFIAYLMTGMIANTLFTDMLSRSLTSIHDFAFLIKEVNFRIAILPLVKIGTELIMHGIMIGICLLLLLFHGIFPTLYLLQLPYYIAATTLMLLGIAWSTTSIHVFFPDIAQIVGILTRFLFFLTPIFWQIESFPKRFRWLFMLNPLFYLVTGYRDSFLYQQGFWERPWLSLYFWGLSAGCLVSGVIVFKRLKPHFADVL